MYRGWTQTEYQNKRYNINKRDEGTQDDRGRDGWSNFILRIKEQESNLILHEHDDDDDDANKLACYIFQPSMEATFKDVFFKRYKYYIDN